jgi:hypothetical protein
MKRLFAVLLTAAGLLPAAAAWGQDSDEENPTIKIVLHPAPEPRPALKYQLLPNFLQRRPGNAAVLYNKVPAEESALFGDEALWEKLEKWREAPLADLRQEEVRKTLSSYTWPVRNLDLAGRCEYCDWQTPVREQEFWTILLPEVQQLRSYSRILAPYARWQIAQGKYDEALQTLRSGYALARYAAYGPTLIHGLVGDSMADMMSKQVEQFIQQPDAPNLYWALSALPRPLVDFRPGFEAEMASVYLSFPELRDLEKKNYPPAYWQQLLEQGIEKFVKLMDMPPPRGFERLAFLALMLEGYPRAKRSLIERGRPAAEVEAMPVPQVILLYTMQTYDELRDDVFKWFSVPYAEAQKGMHQAHKKLSESAATGREIIPLASVLLPAVSAAKTAETRTDRNIAALQILEALRLYAAAHDGRLPENLKDITEVPLPPDPFRGEPFFYYRAGDTAILESPQPAYYRLRYQIQMQPVRKGGKP